MMWSLDCGLDYSTNVGNNISKYEVLEKPWCTFLVLTTFIM